VRERVLKAARKKERGGNVPNGKPSNERTLRIVIQVVFICVVVAALLMAYVVLHAMG
jgi:hypothetical protein